MNCRVTVAARLLLLLQTVCACVRVCARACVCGASMSDASLHGQSLLSRATFCDATGHSHEHGTVNDDEVSCHSCGATGAAEDVCVCGASMSDTPLPGNSPITTTSSLSRANFCGATNTSVGNEV
jgi:uncharacterized protein YjbI with pentapeptide repeats